MTTVFRSHGVAETLSDLLPEGWASLPGPVVVQGLIRLRADDGSPGAVAEACYAFHPADPGCPGWRGRWTELAVYRTEEGAGRWQMSRGIESPTLIQALLPVTGQESY